MSVGDEAEFKEVVDLENFSYAIQPRQTLDNFQAGESENAKGYSGSGVFVKYSERQIEVAGIILRRKGAYSNLVCFNFSSIIDKLLEDNGISPIGVEPVSVKRSINNSSLKSDSSQSPKKTYKFPLLPRTHLMNVQDVEIDKDLSILESSLFPVIGNGNAILILGPYAPESISLQSILNDFAIKNDIPTSYLDNIPQFISLVLSQGKINRKTIDSYIEAKYSKHPIPEYYNIIPKINWKMIFSVSPDTYLEQAFEAVKSKFQYLKIVRKRNGFYSSTCNDELQLVKLNGCIGDLSAYPIRISQQDFNKVGKFYGKASTILKTVSPQIPIILIGFKYSDYLSKIILEKLGITGDLLAYLVDDGVDEYTLPLLEKEKLFVINLSSSNFFSQFQKWSDKNQNLYDRRKKVKYVKKDNSIINIPFDSRRYLQDNLTQLSEHNLRTGVDPQTFYLGEEPSFEIIAYNYDVIRKEKLSNCINTILDKSVEWQNDSVPFFSSYWKLLYRKNNLCISIDI